MKTLFLSLTFATGLAGCAGLGSGSLFQRNVSSIQTGLTGQYDPVTGAWDAGLDTTLVLRDPDVQAAELALLTAQREAIAKAQPAAK